MSGTAEEPGRPLAGVRVLELAQVLAGPYCCMLLADLGADVIKIEPPGGDSSRTTMGPADAGRDAPGFLAVNRSKRSIVLDLAREEGRRVLHLLAAGADVLVESSRPGVAARLGADYPSLSARNPRLVMASISGFGQTGPYGDRPGYDLIAQAMGGALSVTGSPAGPPTKCGLPIADLGAALFTTVGVLAALRARERTGLGQYIDTSLWEAVVSLSVWETAQLWNDGSVPGPVGSAHRFLSPYQVLPTADGHLALGANNERLWQRLCVAIGGEHLLGDPRFATNRLRVEHRDQLAAELGLLFSEGSTAHWVDRLLEAGVPAGPVLGYDQVVEDPHAAARGMVTTVDHPGAGPLRVLGTPLKLSAGPPPAYRPPPLLGQHTGELLAELGLTQQEIGRLLATGVAQ